MRQAQCTPPRQVTRNCSFLYHQRIVYLHMLAEVAWIIALRLCLIMCGFKFSPPATEALVSIFSIPAI